MRFLTPADVVTIERAAELTDGHAGSARFVLLKGAETVVSAHALALMAAVLDEDHTVAAVCPLSHADARVVLGENGSDEEIERALFWSQSHQKAELTALDTRCALIARERWPGPVVRVNHIAVANPDVAREDAGLLLAGLSRREGCAELPPIDDARLADLHISHAWGGGSERWVGDFCAVRQQRRSLVLQSLSDSVALIHGARYALRLNGPHGPIVRDWVLPAPIITVARSDAGYRQMLAQICAEFGVAQIIVSSLIGHSMDALAQPLPTLVVLHDYFPAWPLLSVTFDADESFDAQALATALKAQTAAPFQLAKVEEFMALREAYFVALARPDLRRVAPSRSVVENFARLGLNDLPISVINHGAEALAPLAYELNAPFTVLVLGRLQGGKGEDLIAATLDQLAPHIRVVLLGAGQAGRRFYGRRQTDIIHGYKRAELAQWIERLKPAVALLPSLVAETFSYTLSELNGLGVPTIATTRGSFVERISHGQNGFLVEPIGARVAALIHGLAAHPAALESVRAHLRESTVRSVAAMYADYLALLDAADSPALLGPSHWLSLEGARSAALERELLEATRHAERQKRGIAERDDELVKRAQWGHQLSRDLDARNLWAVTLQADLGQAQREVLLVSERLSERTEWGNERDQNACELEQRLAQAEQQNLGAQRQLAQREGEIKLREDELKTSRLELGRLHRLLSWQPHLQLIYRGRILRLKLEFALKRALNLGQRVRLSIASRGFSETLAKSLDALKTRFKQARPIPGLNLIALENFAFKPFAVPTATAPRVSIVVPVFNKYPYTDACLRALAGAAGSVSFEVIVIDDASSDATAANLAQVEGIRYLRNAENLGFIGSCNRAALEARGEYIVMLNNDTQVQPGWLEALLQTFVQFPRCGMSGAKLVYPDGRLQEAGGIIFADGSGWNYGRLEDPADPRFNYPREADYISGAAICLKRAQWQAFAGFDERYKPAYYEDTDMAFRVREAGMQVIFQPASVVVHFEGVSSGTDLSTGIKRFQVINQEKFRERWREVLRRQPQPRGAEIIDAAREHRVKGRVLIIDATTPTPDQDSGSVRMVNLMRLLLKRGYKVSFFADNLSFVPGYSEALQRMGVEVWHHPYLGDVEAFFARYGKLFDVVILSRHYVASLYIDFVRKHAPRAKLLFDTVDLHYLREERQAELEASAALRAQARKTKHAELDVMSRCDATLVVSPAEVDELKHSAAAVRVHILSNVVEAVGCRRPFSERADIWFIGGFQHTPNVDAMRFFTREVMPLLNTALPQLKLHIVGSKMPEEVLKMARPSVIVHGQLPDVDRFLDGCLALVAPLRFGAGVKGKINMAMAYGQPVISTALGVEGMHLTPNREVLIADSASAFAEAIALLACQEPLWNRLSTAGLANVEKHFSFAAADRALTDILG